MSARKNLPGVDGETLLELKLREGGCEYETWTEAWLKNNRYGVTCAVVPQVMFGRRGKPYPPEKKTIRWYVVRNGVRQLRAFQTPEGAFQASRWTKSRDWSDDLAKVIDATQPPVRW